MEQRHRRARSCVSTHCLMTGAPAADLTNPEGAQATGHHRDVDRVEDPESEPSRSEDPEWNVSTQQAGIAYGSMA